MSSPVMQGFTETLRLAASLSALIILPGARQHDRFITPDAEGTPRIATLEGIVWSALGDLSAEFRFDPATSLVSLFKSHPEARLSGESFPGQAAAPPVRIDKAKLLEAFLRQTAQTPEAAAQRLLLVIDAGLLFQDPSHPLDADYALVQALEQFARTQAQSPYRIILRAPNLGAIPTPLTTSPWVRIANIPAAERDERLAYVRLRGARLADQCDTDLDSLARQLARVTDDWRLEDVDRLIQVCEKQPIQSSTDLEAIARAFRLGASRSPWSGQEIRAVITRAPEALAERVRGQPAALEAICTKLRKATTGLSGAHQSGLSRGPRATYFFAGPTGSGKTEAARSIAELIYGDDGAISRWDCSEFSQEHTVARLIGAPPGYIGHESGGELIEKIRARPFRVILFDEIEKAHPKLFDIFLSILDDGRLTDSHGITADFSESILIFTSNLGVYHESSDAQGNSTRRPRFDYDAPYPDIAREIRAAVKHFFVSRLCRPELLGRLGGVERGIQVFDCLRDLEGVTQKFLENVQATVLRLHGITLTVDPKLINMIARDTAVKPDALVLGARGLAQSLESLLTDPLADFICEHDVKNCTIEARCHNGAVEFHRQS